MNKLTSIFLFLIMSFASIANAAIEVPDVSTMTTEQVEKTTDLLINFLNEPKNISSYSQNIVTSEKKP